MNILIDIGHPGHVHLLHPLDIDSKELATFDETDQKYLEEICKKISPLF